LPELTYLSAADKVLPENAPAKAIAYSIYTLHIQPGIYYQPHPAFVEANYPVSAKTLESITTVADFPKQGTRELIADDYVYEIKRLADPRKPSPIYGFMSDYIVGLPELSKALADAASKNKNTFFDLRAFPLAGVKILDRYTYQIKVKGKYPQFIYWLAMPFFAPVPWEVDRFYSQAGMDKKQISLDWCPVGTGPYMLTENNPNRRMVLKRNPYFHAEYYPTAGMPDDAKKGLLADAGKRLPFVDEFIFTLEKENLPRWNKFLQGYYEQSGISSDSFSEAIQLGADGEPYLTPEMQAKHIYLQTSPAISEFYMGFNMLDPIVGGQSERARKLRLALSIAIDEEEYIAIFLNGRGIPAQGPLPPGIFGNIEGPAGANPYVYNGRVRKPLSEAKALLAAAGYPDGRDPATGHALILNYDAAMGSQQDDAAIFAWTREQFAKLGIHLQVRDTQYNRFQEKMRTGNAQIFSWGWVADYPDPENFLFLLYGPNGKVKSGGENAANYVNPEFDKLFEQMKNMPNNPERFAIIQKMLAIVRYDAPWVFGFYPKNLQLAQSWVRITKPAEMAHNTMKYQRIDPDLRARLRKAWNKPDVTPLFWLLLAGVVIILPVSFRYWRKEHLPPRLRKASLLKFKFRKRK
jgi:oligopeptide transport system substrate-binding protein